MGAESPNVILYDVNGQEMSVSNGSAIPTGTSALMIAGSDGTNSRFITLDGSGCILIVGAGTAGTPAGGVVSIQGVAGGTAVPISGSITATNPSVSATGTAVPASATFVGGEVQAVQSGLTSGDLYPLSMTTTGLLRVDGSNVTQPVSGTVTANIGTTNGLALDTSINGILVSQGSTTSGESGPLVQGAVTTSAPTYTTGQTNAVSLDTSGNLRTNSIQSTKYGTSNSTITCTITSLASSTVYVGRASTAIDNSTNLFKDALVQVIIKTAASSTSATGYVAIYAYGTADGGTTYGESITGTDAGITLTAPPNIPLLGVINALVNATTYKTAPMSVASVFGGRLPQKWGIVVVNTSGATLDASVGSSFYQGVY